MAKLTGQEALPSGSVLLSRWTWQERGLSRKYLQKTFSELGLDLKEHTYRMPNVHLFQDFILGPFRGANLYGILPATTTSNEYLLLGAHYDTEKGAPGANDNASAIALIYGVVAALISEEKRTKNLLVVFFDQ
ncbi:MAG: M28 family peptidase, partial [Bacteroidota bacterium]